MKGFWNFAQRNQCFQNDRILSKKVLSYADKKIGFVMLNTAPLSVLGGIAEDMGSHCISEEQLSKLEQMADADINILVMHHSIEWFNAICKERMRKIISQKYSLVLTGHEHEPVGETRNTNDSGEMQYIQGNALCGYAVEGNGFCTINIDTQEMNMIGYSYLWKNSLYIPKKILSSTVRRCFGGDLVVRKGYLDEISKDSLNRALDKYYVFPGLTYNSFDEKAEVEKQEIETEGELFSLLARHKKIIITGEHKSGKTVLARRLFNCFLEQGKNPLLITASDINKKKIEKTVEHVFAEQYEVEDNAYEVFRQMDRAKKVVLLDEANLINKSVLQSLVRFLESNFGLVILFTEEKMDLNIKKQVVDVMVEPDTLNMMIKPFLYVSRKKLINKVLANSSEREYDLKKETNKINELINTQVKYFNLTPEFIINFVNQYEQEYRFHFTSGMNVFNVVYESSIRNRVIANLDNIDATIVLNILRELAYYMHFGKKSTIKVNEISDVISKYEKAYRQNINVRLFLNSAISAKILVDVENEIRFKDHTLVAYFVAQAINQKYNQNEDIQENIENLLKNLCFSINSDIVLFLALITNNPKFINVIIDGARKHFTSQEELSFDKENIKFLLDTAVPVKNTLPNETERQQREVALEKQEEEVKLSEIVELINEYDYTDEDLIKFENQMLISLKYLEILSKSLPAFCQNMKVELQDKLVELLYRCPNQFLHTLLKDVGDGFEVFCNEIYSDVSMLRKEKNIAEVNIESVKHLIEQISAVMVMALYQSVASTCTTEQTIAALNSFDYEENSNYTLQNLMMISRISDVQVFSKRAQKLFKTMGHKIEKSIVKYTVREYLLRNNVELYGEAQSLIDCFFKDEDYDKIKTEIIKKRITEKDRT